MNDLVKKLSGVTSSEILINEEMKNHTTFRVGGVADVFVTPGNIKEAAYIVRLLLTEGAKYTVIGNGSNLLVSDKGYRGCVVCMGKGTDTITVNGSVITAGAGALLSKVAYTAYENSLTGLEFASGIPGSVGGAVVMNAGAYGGEMKMVITSVKVLDTVTGQIRTLSNEEMKFSYRHSVIKEHPYVVLEAEFDLSSKDRKEIKQYMDELLVKRKEKQPLEYPSAGSTFKRPEGYFAGKLIEDSGLKGFGIGGAKVSEKHCGFVINESDATAADILNLIKEVRTRVYDKFNVMLEPEVVLLGEDMIL